MILAELHQILISDSTPNVICSRLWWQYFLLVLSFIHKIGNTQGYISHHKMWIHELCNETQPQIHNTAGTFLW